MTLQPIAAALQRAQSVLDRRPQAGLHDDPPATSRWESGARVVTRHNNGTAITSDLSVEFGGSGEHVSPGWLFRAGLAACSATSIVMAAATEGIELSALEVRADSRTDARGVLGMSGADGAAVYAGPCDMRLTVRISAKGIDGKRLRAVVERGLRQSPVPNAVQHATSLDLQLDLHAE